MSLPVIISETGLKTFEAICAQILQRSGNKAVKDFKRNTIKTYKETELDPNVRIGLIKKISSVFYEIKPDKIEVLFFWDNRQEPFNF